MDVGGTALVMARHQRVKGGDAVVVRRLDATKRRPLQDRRVVGVAHSGVALDTDIHALSHVSLPANPAVLDSTEGY